MHSHSKLIKSGDVSYYSQSTVDVAQRALRESNEDSNEMTPSARPYKPRCNEAVFMVFLVRWPGRRIFQNTNPSTPQVDVELKRQLRREVLGDLRPILEASGIQFSNIGVVMSDEDRRSSLASTIAGGGRPHEDVQAPASGPSIEPDTIDNLAQPTACSLMLLVGSFRMEVGRGLVYPRQTMLDDVQIDTSSYVVVKVDMVHDNSKDPKLEVPPDDMTLTIQDAVARRVQWR
jgi:hypothetical protein